jgi:hypothetical protein
MLVESVIILTALLLGMRLIDWSVTLLVDLEV